MAEPIICPNGNCNYRGEPNLEPRGSTLLLLALFACFVLPGILYLIFAGGYRQRCPRCNIDLGTAPSSNRPLLILAGLLVVLVAAWALLLGDRSTDSPAATTPSAPAASPPGLQDPIPSEQPGYNPPGQEAGAPRRRHRRRE
jgi:hypothetical protein